MFFTCKNFMFFDFTWKKILFQKMVGGLALPTFRYGPDSCSNLFLKELILSYPIMRRFMLFILISFRKDCGSFSSGPFAFVRGELDDTSCMFWVVLDTISLFWLTKLSLCEKNQTLGYKLSVKRSNLIVMFLCNIKANLSVVHFSCISLLTFSSFLG